MSNRDRVTAFARVVWVASATACGTTAAMPPTAIAEAPREVFSAYHLGALRVEGAPPIDPAITRAIARYDVRSSRLLDLSADGKRAMLLEGGNCVERGVGGADLDLKFECNDADVEWARYGGGTLAYAGDRDGDEHAMLFVRGVRIDIPGGVVEPIWDRSGTRVVFGMSDGSAIDLMMTELATKSTRRVFGDGASWVPLDVSRDGKAILARREASSTESALYRIEGTKATPLTAPSGAAATLGRFGPSGELYVVTDEGGDRLGLEVRTPTSRTRLANDLAGDVTGFALAGDGSQIAFVTAQGGVSTLHVLDVATGAHRVVPAPAGGVLGDLRFAAEAPVIGFSFVDATHPRAVFTYDLRAGKLVRWSSEEAPRGVIAPSIAMLTAVDGVHVPVLAYRPHATGRAPAPAPVVVELHGGPEDQWLPRYQPFVQLLVARGYAVVQPNVRGSAGYGRKFQRLDDREHRADTLRDVGAVLDWIAKQPDLDPQRVVVMGTSYGGYLALASLLAYRDQLRGGITLGAITDLATFLEGTSAYRRDHRRAEYGDERDPETRVRLGKLSPLSRAGEIKRPLLVAHGARDPRVPQANAGALVTAVRAAGTPVWSLVAADEGHFFERPDNRDAFEALAVQFLDETTFPRTPSP